MIYSFGLCYKTDYGGNMIVNLYLRYEKNVDVLYVATEELSLFTMAICP